MKNLRKILYPFSLIYEAITSLRNVAYHKGGLQSTSFSVPIIGIGNLSTGGTGKSPMVEYCIRLLQNNYQVATLSRGYGRSSKGYLEVSAHHKADEVGDEPLQFKTKFPDVKVVVDEQRVRGVQTMLTEKPVAELIILDDVYQHRKIKPGFLILLSSYDAPFYDDLVLPAGNLRESRRGASRATVIIITKCPATMDRSEQVKIKEKIRKYSAAPVFLSKIGYDSHVLGHQQKPLDKLAEKSLTVITGIAKPTPLLEYLKQNKLKFSYRKFPDHHNFSEAEIAELDTLDCILTTEKDYVRLKPRLQKAELYYLPIRHQFLNSPAEFNQLILDYIQDN